MTTDLPTDAAIHTGEIVSLARESIVLVTVLLITTIAYVMWSRVLKPFMDQQNAIATANANALNAIHSTAASHATIAAAHTAQTEHLREASVNLSESAKALNHLHGKLAGS